MEAYYAVSWKGSTIGKVSVRRQGLYYHICCRCSQKIQGICRLRVSSGDHKENLGILVPEGDSFVLSRKIPIKHIGEGELSFQLSSAEEKKEGTFVPISPEEPFSYIARLKESFLVIQEGQPGILV